MGKQVTGYELADDIKTLRKNLRKQMNSIIQTIAADLAIHTERNIITMNAVDTGALLDSIEVKRIKPRLYVVGTNIPYAIYVHEGLGHHHAPRPFLMSALYRNKKRWSEFVADIWKKAVESM